METVQCHEIKPWLLSFILFLPLYPLPSVYWFLPGAMIMMIYRLHERYWASNMQLMCQPLTGYTWLKEAYKLIFKMLLWTVLGPSSKYMKMVCKNLNYRCMYDSFSESFIKPLLFFSLVVFFCFFFNPPSRLISLFAGKIR